MQLAIYILSAVLLIDLVVDSKYFTINLTSIVIISFGSTALMSIFVSYKLFKWFGENRNKFSFIFGLSIFFLFVNNLVSILLFSTLLSEKPWEIDFTTPVVFNFECDASSWYCFFKENVINIQSYTLMIYFAFFWISNYLLLHHHIKKIGKIRFYSLIALPLIFFYFAFIYHYDILYSLTESKNFNETIIFMLQLFITAFSFALCGVLYGIGFKSVANLLSFSPNIVRFLKMATYGIIMLFMIAIGTIAGAALPPFGIPSIVFLPFASLLFYVGVYYSIIAISNDIKVKKYIKNSAYKELEIMGNLAHSQMMDSMKDRILNMTKKYSEELHQKDNSETMESEEDLKSYLDEAISIFKKKDKHETQ
jgi:MFS family permease